MTQFQFDMICKIIQNGAPVLASELCGALNDLVVDYNELVEKVNAITSQNECCDEDSKDENPG